MQTQFVIVLGLAIVLAFAMNRARNGVRPAAWSQQLNGWQKFFGVIAIVATLLIMLNPEFLALGLLGDTAFFDMLVLALTLQMHMVVVRALRSCMTILKRRFQWAWIPSPGWLYLMASATFVIGSVVSVFHKVIDRILPSA
jgi:hypothetical protein